MYLNRKIGKKELSEYKDLIPDNYMKQIKSGKFYLGLISDLVDGKETAEAIYITFVLADWIELIWIHFYDDESLPIFRANLLRYMIRIERDKRGADLKGIFFVLHMDEAKGDDDLRHTLLLCGFELRLTADNVFELTLEQVKERQFLSKASKAMECISVEKAQDDLKDAVDIMIQEDARPVPVGLFVNWDDYLPDVSMICLRDKKPCGLLLFSMQKGYLVMECAYVCDKMALPVMLGRALPLLEQKYGQDQRVLIPIILEKTGALVERLAPEAWRGNLLETIKWF